jgi:ATP-dependent RNA helicase RhlB
LPDIEAFIGQSIPTAPVSDDLLVDPKPPRRMERRNPPARSGGGNKRPRHTLRRRSGA